ncbi:hypothetical protein McanMca71_003360 [Microsporum canis]|uniref:MARVEL domain-containing protein n=1 Tax=Arthroderma otae (strain ATCC MYA-4605 / CBS 113480) TaxID=554155 RepID=C5FSC3_ARTOC|nr:conserved hypothetical protein [Microsporum canis CBS 113480]EEQ32776.1 conserved hypothetical protein [Microsporum canis CBS 113480]
MFSSIFFICWRIGQLITLIPPIGMLSWFIDGFVKANIITPTYILVLFIVSVLGGVWVLETLFRFKNTKRSAIFVSFVDLCFFGSLIAGVYLLRDIANENCNNFSRSKFLLSLGPFGYYGQQQGNPLANDPNKVCSMLKASFAFGIINIISFFWTAVFAYFISHHEEHHEKRSRRGSHSSRRSSHHRHRSSSGRRNSYHV